MAEEIKQLVNQNFTGANMTNNNQFTLINNNSSTTAVVREVFGSGAISLPGMGQVKFLPADWFISSGGLYENNNLMILPPMALVVVGIIIWIQRSRNEALIED